MENVLYYMLMHCESSQQFFCDACVILGKAGIRHSLIDTVDVMELSLYDIKIHKLLEVSLPDKM